MTKTWVSMSVALLASAALLACSGAPGGGGGGGGTGGAGGNGGSGGGGGGGGGGDDGWTGRTNVEAIFASYCSGCHGDAWSTCWDVQQSDGIVTSMISSGAMPRVGTLTPVDKTTLLTWLRDGAPCSGTKPGQGTGGGGGPPPPLAAP